MKRLSREERQQLTRQALLDAAARVFVKRGFQGSSIEEVSAEAGYTRGAFYSNFSSKEELFVALLHERLFARYTEMYEQRIADPARTPLLRETGEELAAIQTRREDRWLLRLWLECLVQASRDEQFRKLAATFWHGNRARGERLIADTVPQHAKHAKAIASAMIALDIGLAIQHMVDPEDAPLDLYPELYPLLFASLARPQSSSDGKSGRGAAGRAKETTR